jgi:tRNA (cmo5U34)-methyltransferase
VQCIENLASEIATEGLNCQQMGGSLTAMSHSVESHLGVSLATYDVAIRRLVPGYDEMVEETIDVLARHLAGKPAPRVLDLGAGTGRMTGAAAPRLPAARFTLLDVNAGILDEARRRLQPYLDRVAFAVGSFLDPLPASEAVVASLSLHHIAEPEKKRAAYANIRAALAPGGILAVSDAAVPRDTTLSERAMKRWSEHLVGGGDTEREAYARFAGWATEERYFSPEEELGFLRAAGFARLDVAWRRGPLAVLVALV